MSGAFFFLIITTTFSLILTSSCYAFVINSSSSDGRKRCSNNNNVVSSTSSSIRREMGGYYSQPDESGRKLEFDHMIFGVPCMEKKINLKLDDDDDDEAVISFIVLDPIEDQERTNDNGKKGEKEDTTTTVNGDISAKIEYAVNGEVSSSSSQNNEEDFITWRLANYLVKKRSELVYDKRILVLGSSNWISLLCTRLGAKNVMVWDSEENETRLRLLEHTDKFLNPRDYSRQKCTITTFTDGERLLIKEEGSLNDDTYIDIDLLIFATSITPEESKDSYIHDFVRRTDAKVLMNENLIDLFGYHTRINEGIDVHLW